MCVSLRKCVCVCVCVCVYLMVFVCKCMRLYAWSWMHAYVSASERMNACMTVSEVHIRGGRTTPNNPKDPQECDGVHPPLPLTRTEEIPRGQRARQGSRATRYLQNHSIWPGDPMYITSNSVSTARRGDIYTTPTPASPYSLGVLLLTHQHRTRSACHRVQEHTYHCKCGHTSTCARIPWQAHSLTHKDTHTHTHTCVESKLMCQRCGSDVSWMCWMDAHTYTAKSKTHTHTHTHAAMSNTHSLTHSKVKQTLHTHAHTHTPHTHTHMQNTWHLCRGTHTLYTPGEQKDKELALIRLLSDSGSLIMAEAVRTHSFEDKC